MRAVVLFLALFLAADVGAAPDLRVPAGFSIETIARVGGARELAALPNGDLLVGTEGSQLYIVPDAEGNAGSPRVFARFDDDRAAGVAFAPSRHEIYVATMHHVYAIAYDGAGSAGANTTNRGVRSGPIAPGTDGDVHTTTSVAYTAGRVYAAAGSSCNATMDNGRSPCSEVDSTRAAVSVMNPDGSDFDTTGEAHSQRDRAGR